MTVDGSVGLGDDLQGCGAQPLWVRLSDESEATGQPKKRGMADNEKHGSDVDLTHLRLPSIWVGVARSEQDLFIVL